MSRKREVVKEVVFLYLFDGKTNEIKEHCFDSYFKTERRISVDFNNYTYYGDVDFLAFCCTRYCLVVGEKRKNKSKNNFIEMVRFELEKDIKLKENSLDLSKHNLEWFDNNLKS